MKRKLLSLFILLSVPVLLVAQDVIASGEAVYNTAVTYTNSSIMGAAIKAKFGKKAVVKKAALRDLEFTRSEPLSKRIQQEFVANLAKKQPAIKPALEKAFVGNKLRNQFDQLLSAYGYSGTNLADAMTAYLVISWQIVHGQEFNDRRGFDAVRKMVRENLLSSTELANSTNNSKQTATETFAYQAMVAMNAYKALLAKKDIQALDNFKSAVYQNVKQSGMDLKALKLTSNGFVKV
jgi:hypothetical protein